MKSFFKVIILLSCFSCKQSPEKIQTGPVAKKENDLIVKANLVASFTNYSDRRDRNYYYLVDVKLINKTKDNCRFYTLFCGSLVNIITDSRQINFLYHKCDADLASLVELHPEQEYSISAILFRNKYQSAFNPRIRFGFVISKPKSGPITNHEIVSSLKSMRENQENVIWSDPVIFTMNNSSSYEIRNIINDSTYSMMELKY